MVKKHSEAEEALETGAAVSSAPHGREIQRVFTLRNIAPKDWIIENIVFNPATPGKMRPVGYRAAVARVIGYVTGSDWKENVHEGKTLQSIALRGMFECQSLVDGSVYQASEIYLPMGYAMHVEAALKSGDVQSVEVDIDVGIRTTGKAIAYEWTATAYTEDAGMKAMDRLRSQRRPIALVNQTAHTPALAAPTA